MPYLNASEMPDDEEALNARWSLWAALTVIFSFLATVCKHLHTTRLSSNLRPATRECVHLVTRGHFRSRDKDSCRTLRSAIAENPMLHVNFMICFIEPKIIADRSFTLWEWRFQTIFDPMTLTLSRWPSHTNLTCELTPSRYTGRAKIKFIRQGFRQLSSDNDIQTDIHTYRRTDRHWEIRR